MNSVLSEDELKVFTDAFFVFDEDRSGSQAFKILNFSCFF